MRWSIANTHLNHSGPANKVPRAVVHMLVMVDSLVGKVVYVLCDHFLILGLPSPNILGKSFNFQRL